MMNQSAMSGIGKMKVVRDGIVEAVAYGQFIEKIKTFLIHFEQHLQVGIRNMVYIPSRKLFGDKIQAVRHVFTPTVNFRKYANALYGAPGKGKSGNISFTLGNNIEKKK